VDPRLTATCDLDAAKRFFRKMLNEIPLAGARSNWHEWGKTFPVTIIKAAEEIGSLQSHSTYQ
jgi:hypothetical protein